MRYINLRLTYLLSSMGSTRFHFSNANCNELVAFFAAPEVEIWRRSWSAGKFVPGSLCFRNNVCYV